MSLCIFLPHYLNRICINPTCSSLKMRSQLRVSVKSAWLHRSSYKSAAYMNNREERGELWRSCSRSEFEPQQQPGHQAAPCFHVSAKEMKCSAHRPGQQHQNSQPASQPVRPAKARTDGTEGFRGTIFCFKNQPFKQLNFTSLTTFLWDGAAILAQARHLM